MSYLFPKIGVIVLQPQGKITEDTDAINPIYALAKQIPSAKPLILKKMW